MQTLTTDRAAVHIAAEPALVYDLVADITRMGDRSPECYRCRWIGGASGPAVGARFKARNKKRIRWSNKPVVTAAERGREFAFTRTGPGAGKVLWRYRLRPVDGGTELEESYEIVEPMWNLMRVMTPLLMGTNDRQADLHEGMRRTLAAIKTEAEQG